MNKIPHSSLKPGMRVKYAHRASPDNVISDECLVCSPLQWQLVKIPMFFVSLRTGCFQLMATINPESFVFYG